MSSMNDTIIPLFSLVVNNTQKQDGLTVLSA